MLRWLWLLPLVLLQACAGSPLAEQFERSFDPEVNGVSPTPPSPGSRAVERSSDPVEAKDPAPAEDNEADDADKVQARQPDPLPKSPVIAAEQMEDPVPEVVSAAPQRPSLPYRVTIRLAGADPSAPAEAVTRALRDASVAFSVERIEAVDDPTVPGEGP